MVRYTGLLLASSGKNRTNNAVLANFWQFLASSKTLIHKKWIICRFFFTLPLVTLKGIPPPKKKSKKSKKCQKWSRNPKYCKILKKLLYKNVKIKEKIFYTLSFSILGGRTLTRAFQSIPFQISEGGSTSVTNEQKDGGKKSACLILDISLLKFFVAALF